MTKLEEVVASVNEKTSLVGEQGKLAELQSRIDASPPLDLTSIRDRRLIKENPIHRYVSGKPKDRYLILLSDAVILCKPQLINKMRFQFEIMFDLAKCTVSSTVNQKALMSLSNPKFVKNLFEVVHVPSQESYVFCASSEQDKAKWVALFEETIKILGVAPPGTVDTGKKLQKHLWSSSSSGTGSQSGSPALSVKDGFGTVTLKKSNSVSIRKRPNLFVSLGQFNISCMRFGKNIVLLLESN